jgi:phage tail sheath protein FI
VGPPGRRNRSTTPEAPPAGRLSGVVVEAGTGTPLAGVRVTSRDVETPAALTGADGRFSLGGLPEGQVALRLEKAGLITLDASGQAFLVTVPTPQRFEMAPQSLPPALTEDAIVEVQTAMAAHGERGLYRVAVLDPPEGMLGVEEIQGWRSRFDTSHAALYWPWLVVVPPGEEARTVPPSGAVTGLIARMDLLEGPQRAAANRPFRNVEALSHSVDDAGHGLLNGLGINVVRAVPGQGIAPQGARTLSSAAELTYLGVRRLLLMIAEAIEEAHQWAVFEPNTPLLRDALRHSLTQFLGSLHRRGALAGATPEAAFAVKCDAENNPPEVVDAGQLVAEIAVAPVRPYEFIRLRLGRTDRLMVQE